MTYSLLLRIFIFLIYLYSVFGFNFCYRSPCRSPSTCENLRDGFLCHCIPGVRGKYCERLLKQNEDLCGSSPCWNGGTCLSNKTNWICVCPGKNKAYDCRNNYGEHDIIVKILNKGWYVAKLTLYYRRVRSPKTETIKQTGSIFMNSDYAFHLPYDVDLSSTWLIAYALLGKNIMAVQISNRNPTCIHTWGTIFNPKWSFVQCW